MLLHTQTLLFAQQATASAEAAAKAAAEADAEAKASARAEAEVMHGVLVLRVVFLGQGGCCVRARSS